MENDVSLHVACHTGNIGILQSLFDSGVTPSQSVLWTACRSGNLDIIEFLVKQCKLKMTRVEFDICERNGHLVMKKML